MSLIELLMRVIRGLQHRITAPRVLQVLDELRDPMAIGLAAATAVLAYSFAAQLEHALAASVAVLVVRTGAGLLMPVSPPTLPSPDVLTDEERAIATLIGEGKTDADIAERRGLTKKAAVKRIVAVQKALGYQSREEVREWAVLVGLVKPPRVKPIPPYEHWLVRTTLMAAGFISLGWTLYNIAIRIWPELAPR